MEVPERQVKAPRSGWRRVLVCLALGALLACAAGVVTLQRSRAAWNAGVEAELAALRAEGLSADFAAIHSASPDGYSQALVRIGRGYQDLPIPSAVAGLQGSRLELLRAALADPESDSGRLAYFVLEEDDLLSPEVGPAPPTLQGGIACLQSACEFLDTALDLLEEGDEPCSLPVPWEEEGSRGLGPVLGQLHEVAKRLETRAALAWIEGDPERAWDLVLRALAVARRHVRQPTLIGALLGSATLRIRLGTVLQHLAAGPPPLAEQRSVLLGELAALDEFESLEYSLRGDLCDTLLELERDPAEGVRLAWRVQAAPPAGIGAQGEVSPVERVWLELSALPRWRHDLARRLAAALRLLHGASPAAGYASLQALNRTPASPLALAFGHYWASAYRERIDAIAVLRLTRIALALAAGEEPPTLADPWGPEGSRLRVTRRRGGGWLLWSRGCDGEDAGGRVKDWPAPGDLSSGVICEPGGLQDDGAGYDLVVFFQPPGPPQPSKPNRNEAQSPPK